MARTIDFSPLTSVVSQSELAAFREEVRNRPNYGRSGEIVTFVIVAVVLVFFGGFVLVSTIGGIGIILSAASDGSPALLATLAFPLLFTAIFVVVAVVALRAMFGPRRYINWLRFERFAQANGLIFSPADPNPAYPGSIFQSGSSRTAVDHFRSATDRFLDYGNYRYTTGSGKNRRTHNWGFLALALDRSLPHMVLDSKANNGLFGSNLAAFNRDQVLSLEGDFDTYFTLYCPAQYERDALYVFTPDLMALLIDNAAPFDVEIMDKWMFVYSASSFDMTQPAVHHRLLSIVDTVGAKTLTQTDRYVDERVADFAANVVAPPGQRLRRRFPLVAILILLAIVGFWVIPVLIALFTR